MKIQLPTLKITICSLLALMMFAGLAQPLAQNQQSDLQFGVVAMTPSMPDSLAAIHHYIYPSRLAVEGVETVVGIKNMLLERQIPQRTSYSWKISSQRLHLSIQISVLNSEKNYWWILQLTILQMKNYYVQLLKSQELIANPFQNNEIALTFSSPSPTLTSNHHNDSLTINTVTTPKALILLTGLSGTNMEGIQFNLRIQRFNGTHFLLPYKLKGVTLLSCYLLVFDNHQLLKRSLHASFTFQSGNQPQTPNEAIYSLAEYELKQDINLGSQQTNMKMMIKFEDIVCLFPSSWNLQTQQCQQNCYNSYSLGTITICLDQDFRQLQDDSEDDSEDEESWSNTPVTCPTSMSSCLTCIILYSNSGSIICSTCKPGFYKTAMGSCIACPIGCATCSTFTLYMTIYVKCNTCYTGLIIKIIANGANQCTCSSTKYMTSTSPPTCVNCPTGCSGCTSGIACTGCVIGYYLTGGLCSQCMPVCKTCSTGSTCSLCINNLSLSGSVCVCTSPNFLDRFSLTCKSCSWFDTNCQICAYNLAYNPYVPTNIVCSVAKQGYFIRANGTTSSCGLYCSNCTSFTVCDSCILTFPAPNGGICQCFPLYMANTVPASCDICSNIIPGCSLCSNSTPTVCQQCNSSYYDSPGGYPTTACLPCPILCTSCLNDTYCTSCIGGMSNISGNCICTTTGEYLDLFTQTCQPCGVVIVNCLGCNDTYPTTCITCDAGSYLSNDSLLCISCPLNCDTCDASGCLICNPGYSNSSGTCLCDLSCQNCMNSTNNTCSSCSGNASETCIGCAAGYYLSNITCLPCLSTCLECINGVNCTHCENPFILDSGLNCICNNSHGLFLTLNSTTCLPCAQVIENCLACETLGSTICSQCSTGLYFNNSLEECTSCDLPCVTCTGSATYCTSCLATYSVNILGFCYCDNSSQLFYSSITQGCLPCQQLIQNCFQCQSDGLLYSCVLCEDPYFSDPNSNSCQLCPQVCTSCTASNNCSACISNLAIIGDLCVCNVTDDPFLYFNENIKICVSCLSMLDNCLMCTPSPLSCYNCANGTYLNGTFCANCPSSCQTCDQNGCLSCPSGLTLQNNDCICDTACQQCETAAPNCINCTNNGSGVVISCSSCSPGFELAVDGISCSACPEGCATCGAGICETCIPTFSLVGSRCECDASLSLYPTQSGDSCALCKTIFYGCSSCDFDGTTTSCIQCSDGFYLNGTICSYCNPACLTCSSSGVCTSCPSGYSLDTNSSCVCGATCQSCGGNITGCTECILTILGSFGQCTACSPGLYLNSSSECEQCPGSCVTCDDQGLCTSCSETFEVIKGNCTCNEGHKLFFNPLNSQCEQCRLYYSNCSICTTNLSISFGFSCILCHIGYYLQNMTCHEQICGDGKITVSQQCDDGNSIPNDGCTLCKIEQQYQCSGEPSICLVLMNFALTFNSVSMSTTICNEITFRFQISPYYDSFNEVNFNKMYAFHNDSKLVLKTDNTEYTPGFILYRFTITGDVEGHHLGFLFTPNQLGVPETSTVPLYPVFLTIPPSSNSVPIIYQSTSACNKKSDVAKYVKAVQYTSYGLMILSALPCKIAGLQLMGVLQLSFISLGNIDHLNPLLASLTEFSGSNGYKAKLDSSEPTKTRLLQTTAMTPGRVQTIGYTSNFLRNCNVMLFVVFGLIIVAFILYALTCFCKNCAPSLYKVSSRLLKQVLLTLILFNCFNFAYSAGLHFSYADKEDQLYTLGTLAAVLSIILPILMVVGLQCSEQYGFGEYKDKLKNGRLEKAYFMITIFYRMGIGYYISTMNEDDLSTLVVLAISIFFLMYNLVNLPFRKAYHNYRANICHISQFICLFVAMYYRSMMANSSTKSLDKIYTPVYLQLAAIGLSLLVSLIVLVYQVYLWICELTKSCCKKRKHNVVVVTQSDQKQTGHPNQSFELSIQNI